MSALATGWRGGGKGAKNDEAAPLMGRALFRSRVLAGTRPRIADSSGAGHVVSAWRSYDWEERGGVQSGFGGQCGEMWEYPC